MRAYAYNQPPSLLFSCRLIKVHFCSCSILHCQGERRYFHRSILHDLVNVSRSTPKRSAAHPITDFLPSIHPPTHCCSQVHSTDYLLLLSLLSCLLHFSRSSTRPASVCYSNSRAQHLGVTVAHWNCITTLLFLLVIFSLSLSLSILSTRLEKKKAMCNKNRYLLLLRAGAIPWSFPQIGPERHQRRRRRRERHKVFLERGKSSFVPSLRNEIFSSITLQTRFWGRRN